MDNTAVATVEIDAGKTRGMIDPLLFGLHLEHIWNCVYPCVWVGPGSAVPNVDGIRADTVSCLSELRPTVCKYPGGYFSDFYDWRDGVGPRVERPTRVSPTQPGREDSNAFGTAEFVRFCRLIGAEPYLAVNTTSITPDAAAHWVEYCNRDGNSFWASKRREHGFSEPFNVRYWAIGNEPYWLHSADEYAQIWQRWTHWMYNTDPGIVLVMGGLEPGWIARSDPWNQDGTWAQSVLETTRAGHGMFHGDWLPAPDARNLLYSEHPYFPGNAHCSESEYAAAFSDLYQRLPNAVAQSIEMLDATRGDYPRPKLCFDEYGMLHPGCSMSGNMTQPALFWSALWLGCFFHICFEHPDDIAMATLPGMINMEHALLLLENDQVVRSPSYHLFKLFRAHGGCQALETRVRDLPVCDDLPNPWLSASASRKEGSGRITLSVINLHLEQRLQCRATIKSGSIRQASVAELACSSLHACNSAESPDAVKPEETKAELAADGLLLNLAPHSVQVVDIDV